jgi:hypothetical protein
MRVRAGWMKFRELNGVFCGKKWSLSMKGKVYMTCVRPVMTYGSETWVLKKEDEGVLQRAERAMVRMMFGIKLRERKSSSLLSAMAGLNEDIVTVVRKSRLRWYGHVMRRDKQVGIRRVSDFEVSGAIGRGHPWTSWQEQVNTDMTKWGLQHCDVVDRARWRRAV